MRPRGWQSSSSRSKKMILIDSKEPLETGTEPERQGPAVAKPLRHRPRKRRLQHLHVAGGARDAASWPRRDRRFDAGVSSPAGSVFPPSNHAAMTLQQSTTSNTPHWDEMDGASRRDRKVAGTSGATRQKNRPAAPESAPPDLLDFVRSRPCRVAAGALGLARSQVQRLAVGYWPSDPRRTLAAWSAYRVRSAVWRLRRVRDGAAGPVVREGCGIYTAPALLGRAGQQVLITLIEGILMAQTLDPPVERFTLMRLEL